MIFNLPLFKNKIWQLKTKHKRITKDSHVSEILDTLPLIYQHVFTETQKLTKTDTFIRTVNYMLQAKQIDFYANDNNYSEVQTIALKLNSIGIRAQVFNTINTVYLEHINPQETLAFVVSHSGSNKTMIDAAYALRKKRIRVIGLTGRLSQDLELVCNENLYIDAYSHHLPHSIMLYGLSILLFLMFYILLYILKRLNKKNMVIYHIFFDLLQYYHDVVMIYLYIA